MRTIGFQACLCLLLAFVPSFARAHAAGDDEIVAEFKKYFRQYKDTATRVEAVLALEGHESAGVVEALVPVLKLEDSDVVRAAVRVLSKFKSPAPVAAVWAELENNKDEAVRSGLLSAVADGKYTGGAAALQACLTEKAWELRRRAVLALAATKETAAVPAMVALAVDPEAAVRCAVLDGLAQMRAQEVVTPAIAALADEVWQVRASAINALKLVRRRDSIGPLVARMATEEGRLQADIGVALGEITGRNFGQRVELWQRFWTSYGERFTIPTDAELAKLREEQKKLREEYRPVAKTTFVGIDTPSRRIMFIIDVSGSMEHVVVEKERFQDGGYPSMARIDIVKTELARTVEGLADYVEFNAIAFATEVKTWKKDLVKANVLNKSSAMEWARRLEAIGGASKDELAQAGLVGAANLGAGKTNTYGALVTALNAAGQGARDKNYDVAIDTIFFLSDGRPSVGDYVDTDDILREIKLANELRKVVIHTIAIGEFQKDFMKRLAEENGGVFVDLGR